MNGEVVATFMFLEESPDGGYIDVVEAPPGAKHKTVRVYLHMGKHVLSLPRRGLGEIIEALQKAKSVSDERYKKLVEKMNQERDDG